MFIYLSYYLYCYLPRPSKGQTLPEHMLSDWIELIPKRNGTDANPVQRFCRCDKTPQIVIRPVYVCTGSCNYCSSAGVQGQQMERIQRRCVWVKELRMEFWQHRWRSKVSLQERVHLSIGQTLCRLVLLAATPT